MQIKVNDRGIIEDSKFKVYGCSGTIILASKLADWVKGKTLKEIELIKYIDVSKESGSWALGGEEIILKTIANYREKHKNVSE